MKTNNIIKILLIVTVLVRFLLNLSYSPIIDNDTFMYVEHISNLNTYNSFSSFDRVENKIKPTSYRTPLFQFTIHSLMKTFGINNTYENIIFLIAIFNIAISGAYVYTLLLLLREMNTKEIIIIITLIISLLDPNIIYNSLLVLTDTYFSFLVLLFSLFYIKSLKYGSKKNYLLSGFFLGLATLTRSFIHNYFFLALLLLFYNTYKIKKNFFLTFKELKIYLFIFAYISTVSIWLVRNWKVNNYFGFETTTGLATLWSTAKLVKIENTEKNDKIIYSIKNIIIENLKKYPWPTGVELEARKKLGLSEKEICSYLWKIGIETIISNKFDFIKIYLRNLTNNITSSYSEIRFIDLLLNIDYYKLQHNIMIRFEKIEKSNKDYIDNKELIIIVPNLFFRILNLVLFITAMIGAYNFILRENKEYGIFFLTLILYTLFFSSLVGSYDRYRLPVEPFINFFTAYSIITKTKKNEI